MISSELSRAIPREQQCRPPAISKPPNKLPPPTSARFFLSWRNSSTPLLRRSHSRPDRRPQKPARARPRMPLKKPQPQKSGKTPMTPKPQDEQSKRFIEAARELECDDDKERF